jgi:SAM-dependent methyltransferase
VKANLLNYLICPACGGSLDCQVYEEDKSLPWLEIIAGCLTCMCCENQFLVKDGIPRMLLGELSAPVQTTVTGFGWEWLKFDRQIQGTYMTGKDNFLDFIYPITETDFDDKLVLDAGCGMGRFLKLGAEFGSREIIGVDLSDSVIAAYQNTRMLANAHVVQADIHALPFPPQFDYIFSVGVLHHLPDPQAGFAYLARLLNDRGQLSAWVYGEENNSWVIHFLSPLRAHLTSRLPRPILHGISHILGFILFVCIKLIYQPANERGLRLCRWFPYNDYLYYSSRLSYKSLVSVVFDHLVPQLSAYISRDEFSSWFQAEAMVDVVITPRNNMSWRGLGTRLARPCPQKQVQ